MPYRCLKVFLFVLPLFSRLGVCHTYHLRHIYYIDFPKDLSLATCEIHLRRNLALKGQTTVQVYVVWVISLELAIRDINLAIRLSPCWFPRQTFTLGSICLAIMFTRSVDLTWLGVIMVKIDRTIDRVRANYKYIEHAL